MEHCEQRVDNFTKRADYLLTQSKLISKDERALSVLEQINNIGRVALIGSAIRTLFTRSTRNFKSDLDFVVEVNDENSYQDLIKRYEAKENNFGGYKITLKGIDIEFWDARKSWAHTQGYKSVNCLEDVLNTTFFNIDAIIYIISSKRIKAKTGALEGLENRFLDINLRPNPNPLGASVRALRLMYLGEMQASDNLIYYIAERIDEFGWHRFLKLDQSAYRGNSILHTLAAPEPKDGATFRKLLNDNKNTLPTPKQLPLL